MILNFNVIESERDTNRYPDIEYSSRIFSQEVHRASRRKTTVLIPETESTTRESNA